MKKAPEYMAPFRKAHANLSEAPAQTSCFWVPGSTRDQFYFYSYTNRCWMCDPTSYPAWSSKHNTYLSAYQR